MEAEPIYLQFPTARQQQIAGRQAPLTARSSGGEPSTAIHRLPGGEAAQTAISQLQVNDRAWMLPHTLTSIVYFCVLASGLWTWQLGLWPITIGLWLLGAHLSHMKLMALHESSHGTLNARRFRNELQGMAVSFFILVPLSVYRYVHGQHHAHLATPRDLELWPYVKPSVPRWARILAATAELTVGFYYSPFIFLRGVLVGGNIPRRERVRMLVEYAAIVAAWGCLLTLVAWRGWWTELTVAYLVPATLAGNMQSLRKFTEHLGLMGDSILTVTRTVVDPSLVGEAVSESMLHVDHHGTHHRYAKVPYYNLPSATSLVYDDQTAALPIFSSYASAMLDMAGSLGNPRIGRQWIAADDRATLPLPPRSLMRAA